MTHLDEAADQDLTHALDRWTEEYQLWKCINADCPGGPTHRERIHPDDSQIKGGVFCGHCTRECIRDYGLKTPLWLRSWIDRSGDHENHF